MYKLSLLPYSYQDLEPFIDTHTMGLHFHKHEQNYMNNLNSLLNKNYYDYRYSLEELVYHINEFSVDDRDSIIFNLGGVLNHDLYWKSMSKSSILPSGKLKSKINAQYGSYDNFWDEFRETALSLKGSGYTFLVLKSDGDLAIINLFNQDLPLLHNYIPLFNIDLWEHAYYLNYENDRARYIDDFRQIADFTNASIIYNNLV